MGLRFRKSFKLAPGIRLNMGMSGFGLSGYLLSRATGASGSVRDQETYGSELMTDRQTIEHRTATVPTTQRKHFKRAGLSTTC